jgi:hypothetical protein
MDMLRANSIWALQHCCGTSRLDIGTCVIDRRRERQPALKPYNFELGNVSMTTANVTPIIRRTPAAPLELPRPLGRNTKAQPPRRRVFFFFFNI